MPFQTLVIIWLLLLIGFYLIRAMTKTGGVGLVTVYLLIFASLHGVCGVIRLLPAFRDYTATITRVGMTVSTYALAGFIAGSLFLTPLVLAIMGNVRKNLRLSGRPHQKLPYVYMAIGTAAFLSAGTLGSIPSLGAVLSAAEALYLVGLCLICWKGLHGKDPGALGLGILLTALLPVITVVSTGFLGYGAETAIFVAAFISNFSPRSKTALVSVLAAYLGLSVYVTYMRDRNEIRRSVWGGESLEKRIGRTGETAANLEFFDPSNEEHLNRLDGRLNQDYLVGRAIEGISQTHEFAYGATIWTALIGLVPRAIWPDKPAWAGSGDLVSHYTGIRFARGTSVGIGHVMEFYVNFGTAGVVVGFVIMGTLITILDIKAREKLLLGDHQTFALQLVVGMSLMQVGGSLVETSTTAVAGIITITLINHYLLSDFRNKTSRSPALRPLRPSTMVPKVQRLQTVAEPSSTPPASGNSPVS